MKSQKVTATIALMLPAICAAQGLAFTAMEPSLSNATADWFASETLQLTDEALSSLAGHDSAAGKLFAFLDPSAEKPTAACKTFPGDRAWPADAVWDLLNGTSGGALIKPVPIAASCYDDFGVRDAARCGFVTSNWANNSFLHTEDPTSVNSVLFQGLTCMPPGEAAGPASSSSPNCTLGGYPSYVMNVTSVYQAQLAVNFARNLNLRLVVKNTGHDFGGKSSGAGALSVWTHNLKDITFFEEYKEGEYRGPAVKVGTGLRAFELYRAAKEAGVTVVGGEGKTVGVMGGYIQGGGHSPLSSLYGTGADQVLSMEVVTPDGRLVTASQTSNPDLFWALRGGGGSTWGVATSVVVKTFPKMKATIMTFSFAAGSGLSATDFWLGVRAFFEGFEAYVDRGNYEYFQLSGTSFTMQPWFAPNMSEAELRALTGPLFARLGELGIKTDPVYREFDNFHDAWDAGFPLEPWGGANIRTASRLFPRENWRDSARFDATLGAIRSVVEEGGFIIGFNIAAAAPAPPNNAVNPAWRRTVLHAIVGAFLPGEGGGGGPEAKAASDRLTFDWMRRWVRVSPGAGAYMSEADYIEPDFQRSFFGDEIYGRLYRIKQDVDPLGVFYAQNAVGSEDWVMEGMVLGNLPSQNSRLCRRANMGAGA